MAQIVLLKGALQKQAMSEFEPIPNQYIVGNPIKTKEMFYGRQNDFDFVKRRLEAGNQSFVIVFCWERRSGKTSVLFQILNGELAASFLAILVDMQTRAGLKNDGELPVADYARL